MNLVGAWRRYWFRPAPVLDLAIARVLAVGFHLTNLVFFVRPMSKQFPGLATLPGLYDPLALLRLVFRPIDPMWFPTLPFLHALYWMTVAAGVLALVGALTNVSLLLFAAGSALIQAYIYSFHDFHHPEAIMMFALLFLALGPSGRRLSVDALVRRLRDTIARRKFEPSRPLEEKSEAARWPVLAIVWFFALIYASAAYYKYQSGLEWMNGYTLRYFLVQDGVRWHMPIGLELARHQTLCVLLSVMSIAFESMFFVVLLFPGLLWLFAPAGFLMHAGIHFAMKADFWEFMVLYLAVMPWTRVLTALRRRIDPWLAPRRPEMVYDGECFLCLRSMAIIDSLDWLGMVRFKAFQEPGVRERCERIGVTPADTRRELHLLLTDGQIRRGFFAVRRLAWFVPALAPFAPLFYLPGMTIVGPIGYRFVADRRRRFETCDNDACRI